MPNLRQIEEDILATGGIDSRQLELLRQKLYIDGKIDRREADFLVELHKRVQHPNRAFEHFFYQAIKDHVLADGRIGPGGAAWLREVLFADGKIADHERKFLHELSGEAKEVSCEFDQLFNEVMRRPHEQHTSG